MLSDAGQVFGALLGLIFVSFSLGAFACAEWHAYRARRAMRAWQRMVDRGEALDDV